MHHVVTWRRRVGALSILGVTCMTPGAAAAQSQAEPDSSPPARIDFAGTVTVPLVPSGGGPILPVVEIMINGRGPYRFGIETGAGFIGVNPGFADSLGLPRAGGSDDIPEFRVDSIALGAATFRDVLVAPLPGPARGVAGVLGLPFFRNILLTIDYPGQRVLFSRDTLPDPDGATVLALSRAGPFWAMPITMADHALVGVLDTRSTGVLGVTPEVAATLPFADSTRVIGRAGGAAIPVTTLRAGRLDGDVVIGAFRFPRPEVTIRALPPGFPTGPLIGAVVLQNFVVSLDQRHGRLRLVHPGSTTITLPEVGGSSRGSRPSP